MRHFSKERIKSIVIAGLLITSLIQVGILWGYQSQGTPTDFFKGIFGWQPPELSDDAAREKLFTPYRLIVSNGNSSHWLISRQDSLFEQINHEADGYLKEIAEGNLKRSKPLEEDWGDISSKQGFTLEFKTAIKPDLLKWFTGSKVSVDTPSVLKMKIIPDSVDESTGEIYILGSDGGLSEYSVSNVERPQSMKDMLSAYEDKNTSRNYSSIRDSKLDTAMPFDPDVLYIARSPEFWSYCQLRTAVPIRLASDNELTDIMLGSEKDRYIKTVSKGLTQFSTTENIYKVCDDGYLSYKYLADTSLSDKGGIGEALLTAYLFINRLDGLTNMKTDIYLSGIDDTHQGFYRFMFDYRFNDMPVFINLQTEGNYGGKTVNAITIDASSKRVLQCDWILREFSQGAKQQYNDRFFEAMQGINYSGMKISDITAGYYLDSANMNIIDPSFVIQERDKDTVQAYRMLAGKGD